jgi:crossover junction endodeoxyribonuclease RusA
MTSPTLVPTRYTITLPTGMDLINANRPLHFRVKAVRARAIRQAANVIARSQKIPRMEYAHAFYLIHPTKLDRRRDPGNWAASAKPAIDGIVDAGILRDDNSRLLLGPDPRLGSSRAMEQLVLVITDLSHIDPVLLPLLDPTGQLDLHHQLDLTRAAE